MSWKTRLRKGSFKGLPFYLDSSETTSGRKTIIHDIPFREKPDIPEDTGKVTRKYKIKAFILGGDYMSLRDSFISLSEDKAVGSLIHPYYGLKIVKLISVVNVRESRDEGGYAEFNLTFLEAEEKITFDIIPDTLKNLLNTLNFVNDSANSYLDDFYSLSDQVFTTKAIFENSISSLITLASGSITGAKDTILAVYNKLIGALQGGSFSALNFKELTNSYTSLEKVALESMVETIESTDPDFIQDTKLYNNVLAVSAIASVNSLTSFITKQEALEAQRTLLGLIESFEESGNYEIYSSLQEMKLLINEDIQLRVVNLPSIIEKDLTGLSVDLLNVQYDLYENFDNTDDIMDRNEIINPLFAGNTKLEFIQ